MAMKPVAQWGTNWQASQPRAVANYIAGVQATTADWAGNLLRQKAVMVTNWGLAVNSPAYDAQVNAIGNNGWKTATEAKQANYTTGFSAGLNEYNQAAQKVYAALQTGLSSIGPRGDINQNLARANQLALFMHSRKGTLSAAG